MNKKEISELKKQFTPDNCTISRICGCYVDSEKEKRLEMRESFLSLSDEEMFKYFEIFKKTLSGTIGKNLLNLEFPLKAEAEGGEQEFLLMLLLMNVMTRSSNIITMRKIILSFSYMLPTMFLERPKIIQRCSILPMRFTNTSCAASAR